MQHHARNNCCKRKQWCNKITHELHVPDLIVILIGLTFNKSFKRTFVKYFINSVLHNQGHPYTTHGNYCKVMWQDLLTLRTLITLLKSCFLLLQIKGKRILQVLKDAMTQVDTTNFCFQTTNPHLPTSMWHRTCVKAPRAEARAASRRARVATTSPPFASPTWATSLSRLILKTSWKVSALFRSCIWPRKRWVLTNSPLVRNVSVV